MTTIFYLSLYRTLTNSLSNEMQSGSRGKNWAKAVQKEWKILENDLPGTSRGKNSSKFRTNFAKFTNLGDGRKNLISAKNFVKNLNNLTSQFL
jgi:hypothetical protein